MLFLLHKSNHRELSYRGGQGPIVHLEGDLMKTVAWAESKGLRWAFTLSNAGSCFFEDRAEIAQLDEIDWEAVGATDWSGCKEKKQAEFLVEKEFPWELVTRVGVQSEATRDKVLRSLQLAGHRPPVNRIPGWYY